MHTVSVDPVPATKTEGSRKNPKRTESEKRTFDPRTRAHGNEPSEPPTPILTSKATGQTFARIRPDKAIAALRKARFRPRPSSHSASRASLTSHAAKLPRQLRSGSKAPEAIAAGHPPMSAVHPKATAIQRGFGRLPVVGAPLSEGTGGRISAGHAVQDRGRPSE
jgi:hypothetical protein